MKRKEKSPEGLTGNERLLSAAKLLGSRDLRPPLGQREWGECVTLGRCPCAACTASLSMMHACLHSVHIHRFLGDCVTGLYVWVLICRGNTSLWSAPAGHEVP